MDARRTWLMALGAAWVLAWAASVGTIWSAAPVNLGAVRAFLGWQGAAAVLALAIRGVGLGWPRGSGVRRLSCLPLRIALLTAAALAGFGLWQHRFSVQG